MARAPKKTETTPTVRAKRTRRATDTPGPIAEVVEVQEIQMAMPVTEAEISRLAYQIYQNRGGTNGSPLEDWLEAERQLLGR